MLFLTHPLKNKNKNGKVFLDRTDIGNFGNISRTFCRVSNTPYSCTFWFVFSCVQLVISICSHATTIKGQGKRKVITLILY